jgi:hypothetical protein
MSLTFFKSSGEAANVNRPNWLVDNLAAAHSGRFIGTYWYRKRDHWNFMETH